MAGLIKQRAISAPSRSRLTAQVFVTRAHPFKEPQGANFSPTTATLISGKSKSVLIDTLVALEDVDALGDHIEEQGASLDGILITHGHPDHYFGADRLAARFSNVRVVAARGVVDYIRDNLAAELALFENMLDVTIAKPTSVPQPLASDVIDLEGEELRILNVGQGDIAPSTIIWIPSLGTVVAGDIAYNSMHLMLGLTGPAEWHRWIESLNAIRKLNPSTIIAGHKKPEASDHAKAILDGTEAYIRDFIAAVASANTAQDIVASMCVRYPDYPNVTILRMSAEAAVSARRTGVSGGDVGV
jgi:glyoxylase-like metal-dependent hydrolase (beta-lactamase superfamily II)